MYETILDDSDKFTDIHHFLLLYLPVRLIVALVVTGRTF